MPEEIISKLQLRGDPETVKAVIQKAHQELITNFSCLFLKDLWEIVLNYLSLQDNVQMVTTVADESRLSFFALQIPREEIALLKSVLTPLIGKPLEWKTMHQGNKPLSIEIGINKSSGRPALATRGKDGFLIILDEKNKLVVKNKSNNYAVLNPFNAFAQIREFGSLVKLCMEPSKETLNKKDDNCLVM